MDAPLDGLACLHFALIYIDDNGKLRFEASPSIANSCQTILSPNVTENFLRAVALAGKGDSNKLLEGSRGRSPLSPESPNSKSMYNPTPEPSSNKRKRVSHECLVPMSITCHQKTMLPIRDASILRRYYEKAFDGLQQINCRILAKAYIKLVEPRKQVNYPYNGRKIISGTSQQFDPELTKPAWWPAGVTHREPDHLLKNDRVRLLVHILCELRESHGICVEKLKEADQAVRRQIAPVERLAILDEIYHVREEEERYLDGRTDGPMVVCVSRVHLPEQLADSQSMGSPTSSSMKDGLNPVYRKEIPDLESHTSVFPSTNSSPVISKSSSGTITATTNPNTSPAKSLEPCKGPSVQVSWDSSTPTSSYAPLSGSNTLKRPREGDSTTTYPLDLASGSMYHHHEPSSLDASTYPLKYYPHTQAQTTLPVIGLSSTDLGGCPNPYYFNY
ncbi:DUF2841 domain-containing protein [Aspergillus homomorphus CBS 101889]|uniref:Subtelomeric hrmA-associated cluster protein AFUB-079030/YDR124W-like helical bundle domain-containing protein n=1 Tax=Aspergillus homomorphus (strain CBS 101889) TaxID=1450537 RepID=A0A395HXC3_ASPHC|nr:hypothetical protein BO97DRAFT_443151 [Aspergillus homomorphus CBS 101889]RAL12561.1 hypothetical protein BO97DRAFT_443151 [Aspergillus homomorphus CBS 101889]